MFQLLIKNKNKTSYTTKLRLFITLLIYYVYSFLIQVVNLKKKNHIYTAYNSFK